METSESTPTNGHVTLQVRSSSDFFTAMVAYVCTLTSDVKTQQYELMKVFERREKLEFYVFPMTLCDTPHYGTHEVNACVFTWNGTQVRVEMCEDYTTCGLSYSVDRFRKLRLTFAGRADMDLFLRNFYLFYERRDDSKINVYVYSTFWQHMTAHSPRSIDTIYMNQDTKKSIIDDIERFRASRERYARLGVPYKRNYLFTGEPGTGKSSMVFAIASKFHMKIYIMSFTHKIDDHAFASALHGIESSDAILLLEDIDCLFKGRESTTSSEITFSGVINCLDGVMRKEGLIVVMTTNYADRLDAALKRPSRVDRIIHFTRPDRTVVAQMFAQYFPNMPERERVFERFYRRAESLRPTTAALQTYFFDFEGSPPEAQTAVAAPDNIERLKVLMCAPTEEAVGLYM